MRVLTLLSCILGAIAASTLVGCETKVVNNPPDSKTVIHEHRDGDRDRTDVNIRVQDK